MKVGIIGSGSWGTALAQHLATNLSSHQASIALWGRDDSILEEIKQTGFNSRYLPEIKLSEKIIVTKSFAEVVNKSDILILSVPTSATREICVRIKETLSSAPVPTIINTAKGLESHTNLRLSEIVRDVFREGVPVFSFSGPSFALEVAKGMPTAMVLADDLGDSCKQVRDSVVKILHVGTMRVYTSSDLVGVELGGVLKNVISVASGIGDGLGLGLNARAGLLTRGLRELSTLIQAEGGQANTVIGLSGLGDLLLTSTGDLSRNRKFGILLGRGLSIAEAKEEIGQTIEAITACICAFELSKKHKLDTPIIEQVAKIISGESTPSQALRDLLMREQKAE